MLVVSCLGRQNAHLMRKMVSPAAVCSVLGLCAGEGREGQEDEQDSGQCGGSCAGHRVILLRRPALHSGDRHATNGIIPLITFLEAKSNHACFCSSGLFPSSAFFSRHCISDSAATWDSTCMQARDYNIIATLASFISTGQAMPGTCSTSL